MTTQERKGEPDPKTHTLSKEGRDLLDLVTQVLGDHRVETGALLDKPQILVAPQDIVQVCRILKDDPRTSFKLLLCIAAVDYQEYIQMVYLLHSIDHRQTLALKVDLPYHEPEISSLSSLWRGADWYEREAHDLFGVHFDGHPDLSPLLLYEGFEGHPGLKEFPFHEYEEY